MVGLPILYFFRVSTHLAEVGQLYVHAATKSVSDVGRAGEDVSEVLALLKLPAFRLNQPLNLVDAAAEAFKHALATNWVKVTEKKRNLDKPITNGKRQRN